MLVGWLVWFGLVLGFGLGCFWGFFYLSLNIIIHRAFTNLKLSRSNLL